METYLGILRDKGFKITPLRKAMLGAFRNRGALLTAKALRKILRRQIPNVGLQSVYRNLADFTKVGITEEMFVERRKAAYALCKRVASHHHHVVCLRCGRSGEIEACELGDVVTRLERSIQNIKKETGFIVERHSLQLEGLCHGCQAKKA